ncbi:hypothetical protein SFRURICE_012509, partial [Spodoptera frugiperda]
WLVNRLRLQRVRFPHVATLCVTHKLLFRVWVSCVCELEDTFERMSKYNNINNVCLSVSPLVKLFGRSKV